MEAQNPRFARLLVAAVGGGTAALRERVVGNVERGSEADDAPLTLSEIKRREAAAEPTEPRHQSFRGSKEVIPTGPR
ncbi:hypothetical protein LBMAG42_54490 [Deltaproteobacteria bacterium]|nr:hypothetical protein LBMAG42_54490 [Deltaproteobacteria bacterium]